RYLGRARMPVLFVNGTNDFAYPLGSYQKSYRLVKDRTLCVTVNLPHGHPQGWAPVEIGLFAHQHPRGGRPLAKGETGRRGGRAGGGGEPLAKVESVRRDGGRVEVRFRAAVPVPAAALHTTTDTGPWQKRKWQSRPVEVGTGVARAELPPERPLVYFVTLTDS